MRRLPRPLKLSNHSCLSLREDWTAAVEILTVASAPFTQGDPSLAVRDFDCTGKLQPYSSTSNCPGPRKGAEPRPRVGQFSVASEGSELVGSDVTRCFDVF